MFLLTVYFLNVFISLVWEVNYRLCIRALHDYLHGWWVPGTPSPGMCTYPICRNCQWQHMKFLSMIWHKTSPTQTITEQRPSTAQDSLSKWAVLWWNCIICQNLSLTDWHLLTGLQIGYELPGHNRYQVMSNTWYQISRYSVREVTGY